MLVSAIICLPSLYIFACLSGSQARLAEIFGLVMGMLMLTTILLIGFAPVAWLFSQSTESVNWMGTLHLIFWFIASIFGLRFLNAAFSHTQAKSNAGFNTWVVIFMLVVVQMTTALRPIVGHADSFFPKEKKFFLSYWADCLRLEPDRNSQNR
jgi:amino acid permease